MTEIIIGWTFRFETQFKVWRSSLIFPRAKSYTRNGTEFILLPDFSKESIGKICILNSFIHSALTTSVEPSLWKVKVRKHFGFHFIFAAFKTLSSQNILGEWKKIFFFFDLAPHQCCLGWWTGGSGALFLWNRQLMGTPMQLHRICLIKCISD